MNSKDKIRRLFRQAHNLGPHKRKESNEHKRKHERTGICLCCGKISDHCICSGYMTEKAMKDYFAQRQAGKT
jgi:hypothetical protein